MKVFIVTSGSYSDYGVEGVFSTEAVATLASTKFYNGGVIEMEVDAIGDAIKAGRTSWEVNMLRDGEVRSVHPCGFNSPHTKLYSDFHCLIIQASSAEHAVKIVNEIRLRWIAAGCPHHFLL